MKALMSEMLRCTSWVNTTERFDDQQSQKDSFKKGKFACVSVLLSILNVLKAIEDARYYLSTTPPRFRMYKATSRKAL